jgi:hypothetical protein
MGEVDLLVLKVEWLKVQQVESFVELFFAMHVSSEGH